ncbi:hypothetical protein I4U23_014827 [Adineta vaga]|nr:hypothetical protein I4U23_014827 [Adineta vaga]
MMFTKRNTQSWRAAMIIIIFGMILLVLYLFSSHISHSIFNEFKINKPNVNILVEKPRISFKVSNASNATHLWSLRFADETYFRIARSIPCRTVEYTGGPKKDPVNSCNKSSTDEFSLENIFQAQKWLYDHQHPVNCTDKQFAIIRKYAWSGFGSTVHQIVWAFGVALSEGRIAVYDVPGHWMYGDCNVTNPDCVFLPITNCSLPRVAVHPQVTYINADFGHWAQPVHPPVFQNRTFNWYRAQLLFYLLRLKPETLTHVQKMVTEYLKVPSVDSLRPYIAVYVRRSDKVTGREMSQAYPLKQYFDLFDADVRRANITNIYLNSEDEQVFNEFIEINKEKQGYYKLFTIKTKKNVVYATLTRMSQQERGKIVLEFLIDLFIEAHADLHAGTLTSNWCRLVDEMRLTLGKTSPYYTPENRYLLDM